VTTDVNGFANATLYAVMKNWVVPEASLRADVFVRAYSFGYYSLLTQTQVVIHARPCFVAIDPMPDVYDLGDLVRINTTVTDSSGTPLSNMTVTLAAGEATLLDDEEVTDALGQAVFWVFTSSITNHTAGYMLVIATADGVGYRFSQARASVALKNGSLDSDPPVADAGADQNVQAGLEITFDGSGSTDNVGVVNWTWTFTYDSVDYVLYGELVNFTFLSEPGSAVVTLTVYDAQGNSDTDTMTVNVSGWIPEFAMLLLPVAGVAGILLFLSRRGRKALGE
jgi:hypothetical protein